MNKILLLGCGHMGSALLNAWMQQTDNIFTVVDPLNHNKISSIFKKKRLKAFKSIVEVKNIESHDIIIFAIKPQAAEEVLKNIKGYNFNIKTIFVSIVAGKKLDFYTKHLRSEIQFIRVMPNMPALINQGISSLICNKNVSLINRDKISSLFKKLGKIIWLKNELDVDKVTAISGSGPGYIFLFIDAFEKAALTLGLDKKSTKALVDQTLFGSINLFLKEKKTAEQLAFMIAVKGGTTEAGINEFTNKKILHNTFNKAIKSAYKKAKQLGK